jgi:hypothetical protein
MMVTGGLLLFMVIVPRPVVCPTSMAILVRVSALFGKVSQSVA